MVSYLKEFLSCDVGVTSIEYALIALFIVAVIVYSVAVVGQHTLKLYESIGTNYPK